MKSAYPVFQQTRGTEPLAELLSLFPMLFFVIVAFVIGSVYIVSKHELGQFSMLAILFVGALILWYTPYAIAGFVKQTDTLWHMGTAMKMPEVLGGESLPFSSYLNSFPISFSFGYIVSQITGLEITVLANYLMPLVYICILIPMFFTIFRSIANQKAAFIATLIGIGLMYHVSLHHSPQVVGTVLLLLSVMLLLKRNYLCSAMVGFILLPVTHIISFALFLTFLVIYVSIENFMPQMSGKLDFHVLKNRKILGLGAAILLVLAAVAFVLRTYLNALLVKLSFSKAPQFVWDNLVNVPWFKQITSIQYLLVFATMSVVILKFVTAARKRDIGIFTSYSRVKKNSIIMNAFAWASLVVGLVVALAGNSSVLIERGVTFFVLFSVLYLLARYLKTEKNLIINLKNNAGKLTALVIVIGFLTYPLGSYPIDAYNSFPQSEKAGLVFFSEVMDISNSSVDMSSPGQLNAFIEPGTNIVSETFVNADFVVWRLHAEYKDTLHGDSYVQFKFDLIDQNVTFIKVYSNPTFNVYENVADG